MMAVDRFALMVAHCDFAEEFQRDLKHALDQLQCLLLNRDLIDLRIQWITMLADGSETSAYEDFSNVIDLLSRGTLFQFPLEKTLTEPLVRAITRMTYSPAALEEAHRRLTEPE